MKKVYVGLGLCIGLLSTSAMVYADSNPSNTLVVAGESEDTINPILNNHEELPTIIFSGLMKYDEHGLPIPDLAEKVAYDPATFTYTFTLRSGVKWQDGRDFNADDVVYTYDELTKDKRLTASITSNYQDIQSITESNKQTVRIKLFRYNAAMLDYFTIGILPKHLYAGKDVNTAPANYAPVGTGRYKFVKWDTAGGMITLARNDDYYGKVPNIQNIVYKTVADENTKALMLRSGEADMAWLNAKYADTFRGDRRYRNDDFVTADYRSVDVDFNSPFWRKNRDSIGVLNYAIDKKAIVKSVIDGCGVEAYSPIQFNSFGGNKAADIYHYDLAKFAKAMSALGWHKGADGIYERNGMKFSFTLQVRDYEEERVDIANIVAKELKDVGVDMRVNLVTHFDWKAGYDGFLAGYAAEFDPDGVYKGFVTGASDNTMSYSNADVDRLLVLARTTQDPAKRKALYGQFEQVYAQHPGQIFIAYLQGNYVSTAALSGLDTRRVLGHHAVGVMWNIENWTLNR